MAFTLSSKDFRVAERLEHVAAEVLLQVYLAGGAVAEAKPYGVATPVASLKEFRRTHDDNVGSATRRRQGVGCLPRGVELDHRHIPRALAKRGLVNGVLGGGPLSLGLGAVELPERAHEHDEQGGEKEFHNVEAIHESSRARRSVLRRGSKCP